MTFPFPWRQSMPGGYHSNSLLFKAHTALAHPLPPITLYPIPRMGVRHRESTPAGLLLIGYFSFLLLCYCHNFLFLPFTGLLLVCFFFFYSSAASVGFQQWCCVPFCPLICLSPSGVSYKNSLLLLLLQPECNLWHQSFIFI